VSGDYGASFKALPSPGGTEGYGQELRLHPRQPDWVLAKVRRNECLLDRRSPRCGYDLFLSQDFGESWTNLTANSAGRVSSFRDYDWGCKMEKYAGKPTPDEAIFATVYASASSQKGLYPGWDKDLHYVVSLDFFKTPVAKMVPCGNLFEIVAKKVYLAVPSECPVGPDGKARKAPGTGISGRSVTMYVSDADGDDFTEVCLPVDLEDDGYNMVHTHDNDAAFILADHAEPGSAGPQSDSPTSDAYAPAYSTSFYTLRWARGGWHLQAAGTASARVPQPCAALSAVVPPQLPSSPQQPLPQYSTPLSPFPRPLYRTRSGSQPAQRVPPRVHHRLLQGGSHPGEAPPSTHALLPSAGRRSGSGAY
jgi:hypothetical protein